MNTAEALKEIVRQKYGEIAIRDDAQGVPVSYGCESVQTGEAHVKPTSCCGPTHLEASSSILMNDNYQGLNGYTADADLGLGCGLPTQFAQIKPGDTVIDLGSGTGNDCFVARAETGETGRVIGLDMTPAMIDRARKNVKALGYTNIDFVYGDIEEIPLSDNLADVVVSNCVMNLVPDKRKAFAETYRILKPGGHFSISDIILKGDLPKGLQRDAELYAGCVSGAIQTDAYLQIIQDAGFENIAIQKERVVTLPDQLLLNYLLPEEIADYQNHNRGIYSVTVFAQKPHTVAPKPFTVTSTEKALCCEPGCC
jgi:arsenite methyltransferase